MMDKASLAVVAPEIFLLLMACVIAMVDLGVKTRLRNLTYGLTMLTLGLIAWYTGDLASRGDTAYAFNRMLVSDSMANWLKCFATIAMMVCLVYGRPYAGDRDMLRGGEFFTLSMLSLLGIFVMISGLSLIHI